MRALIQHSLRIALTIGTWAMAALLLSQPSAAQEADELADPERFASAISMYESWTESQQAMAVGNVLGHMAAMFRLHPDRTDAWLADIRHDRVEAFAVIALGLAGDPARAQVFATGHEVDVDLVVSVLAYAGGDRFESPGPVDYPLDRLLSGNGRLETTPQIYPWHQDVLWSAAAVVGDGQYAIPILEHMDELFRQTNIKSGNQPVWAFVNSPATLKQFYESIKVDKGERAAWEAVNHLVYLGTGGWSFASNLRYPHVAEAFEAYARENPDSEAVKEVRLFE